MALKTTPPIPCRDFESHETHALRHWERCLQKARRWDIRLFELREEWLKLADDWLQIADDWAKMKKGGAFR